MATAAAQNPSIQSIYQSLCDQQDALSAKIQTTTDPVLAGTISNEIQEIAHRIILTQNLLFVADTAALASMVAGIQTSSKDLTQAIGEIQNVTGFLNSVSGYLADVDQAIDLAKTVAAAVG